MTRPEWIPKEPNDEHWNHNREMLARYVRNQVEYHVDLETRPSFQDFLSLWATSHMDYWDTLNASFWRTFWHAYNVFCAGRVSVRKD
jgi:hypothetical protein